MKHSIPSRSLWLALGLAGSLFGPSALASDTCPERWLVTTTDNISTPGLMSQDDASLIQVGPQLTPHTYTAPGNWFALAGFEPTDIDAVGLFPMGLGNDHRAALSFSLLSNEDGFLDGDVLGIGPGGGLVVRVPEAALTAALGVPGASIDVDALDYDSAGRLYFSLQGFLAGTIFGDVNNGDILRLELDGSVTRPYTEADVQLAYEMSGAALGTIGDVQGLTSWGGSLFVAVQSPSSADGGVLRLGIAPELVVSDLDLGLGGAELDGLTALDASWQIGAIALDTDVASPGAFVHAEGHGFTPNAPVLQLMAGQAGYDSSFQLEGFGELFIDPLDPWLLQSIAASGFAWQMTDGSGSFALDFQLPPGNMGGLWMDGQGWSFQVIDLANLAATAPFRVQLQ